MVFVSLSNSAIPVAQNQPFSAGLLDEDFALLNKPLNVVTLSNSEESGNCLRSFASAQDDISMIIMFSDQPSSRRLSSSAVNSP